MYVCSDLKKDHYIYYGKFVENLGDLVLESLCEHLYSDPYFSSYHKCLLITVQLTEYFLAMPWMGT